MFSGSLQLESYARAGDVEARQNWVSVRLRHDALPTDREGQALVMIELANALGKDPFRVAALAKFLASSTYTPARRFVFEIAQQSRGPSQSIRLLLDWFPEQKVYDYLDCCLPGLVQLRAHWKTEDIVIDERDTDILRELNDAFTRLTESYMFTQQRTGFLERSDLHVPILPLTHEPTLEVHDLNLRQGVLLAFIEIAKTGAAADLKTTDRVKRSILERKFLVETFRGYVFGPGFPKLETPRCLGCLESCRITDSSGS